MHEKWVKRGKMTLKRHWNIYVLLNWFLGRNLSAECRKGISRLRFFFCTDNKLVQNTLIDINKCLFKLNITNLGCCNNKLSAWTSETPSIDDICNTDILRVRIVVSRSLHRYCSAFGCWNINTLERDARDDVARTFRHCRISFD